MVGIDPTRVGIIGFSAGGHLASLLSTQPDLYRHPQDDLADRVSARPDLVVLGYPVISFVDGYSPVFIWTTRTDGWCRGRIRRYSPKHASTLASRLPTSCTSVDHTAWVWPLARRGRWASGRPCCSPGSRAGGVHCASHRADDAVGPRSRSGEVRLRHHQDDDQDQQHGRDLAELLQTLDERGDVRRRA